jgi:hypothetical protein
MLQMPALGDSLPEQLQRCAAIAEAASRLACYDRLAAPPIVPPVAVLPPAEGLAEAAPEPTSATPPETPPETWETAGPRAPSLRVEAGGAYGHGAYSGTIEAQFNGRSLEIESDNGTGGVGKGAYAALWIDDWIADDVAIGLQYWHLYQEAKLTGRLPEGIGVLADPVSLRLKATFATDVVLANVQGLFGDRDPWTILFGGGLGWAYTRVRFAANTDTDLVPEGLDTERNVSFHTPVGQLTAGTQLMVWDPLYLSLGTTFIGGSGEPFGQSHSFYDLLIALGAGARF